VATLLLVDDDRAILQILYDLLSGAYECHTADRAEQALEYLEVETYDVVITDISMPGLSGVEILRRVKERMPATPVIIISGMVRGMKDDLIAAGAFAFLSKPFQLEEIEDTVVRAIASRGQLVAVDRSPASRSNALQDASISTDNRETDL
jgi:DNA-binding NtrC family response regulator